MIPSEDEFPYAIRVVSEVMESNGSSSMASTCGSTLALMDAGVPLARPVSGVAMGLIQEEGKTVVLTDIQGLEDFLGDMDFKVCGTVKGITAMQMDNKATGLTPEILRQALMQAHEGRMLILDAMLEQIPAPRESTKESAPQIISIQIPTDKIRDVIGSGGKVIRGIQDDTGATIDIQEDGTVFIAGTNGAGDEAAERTGEAHASPMQIVPSGPAYRSEPGLRMFVDLIHCATRSVSVVSPYFIPDEALLSALTNAALKGVDVELFVSEESDQFLVGHAQRSYYEPLLKSGVRIHLYQAPTVLHSKYVMIDRRTVTIGSSNMDFRSFGLNYEVMLLAEDPGLAEMIAANDQRYRERSRELTLAEWIGKPWYAHYVDNVCRLGSALL